MSKLYKNNNRVWKESFRFYLTQNQWRGIDDVYGSSYYQANQNYQSVSSNTPPNPSYLLRGFVAPSNIYIKKIKLIYNRPNSAGNTAHLALVKQVKEEGTTNVTNSVLYHDTAGVVFTPNITNPSIEIEINDYFDQGDVLGILWNKSTGGGTDYIYSDVIIEYRL